VADDVRGTQKEYPKHLEGQFCAAACDIVDLGQKLVRYQNNPPYLADKFSVVFRTDSEGEVKEISAIFSNTLGPKGLLLPFLTAWRGKSYTKDELRDGIAFAKMVGYPALITVEHKTTESGKTFANISGITKLPKGMKAPDITGYKRAEYWQEKRKAYTDEVKAWADAQLKVQGGAHRDDDDAWTAGDEDNDSQVAPF
jgi:hypothetical protein